MMFSVCGGCFLLGVLFSIGIFVPIVCSKTKDKVYASWIEDDTQKQAVHKKEMDNRQNSVNLWRQLATERLAQLEESNKMLAKNSETTRAHFAAMRLKYKELWNMLIVTVVDEKECSNEGDRDEDAAKGS